MNTRPLPLLLALAAAAVAGCHGSGPSPAVADFLLLDVNPGSSTYGDPVSPRHHLDHLTAWYFGEAT